jgi:hypothetical protein
MKRKDMAAMLDDTTNEAYYEKSFNLLTFSNMAAMTSYATEEYTSQVINNS